MVEVARNTDHLGEYNGSQVAALLPNTDRPGAQRFVEKLELRTSTRVPAHILTYPGTWQEADLHIIEEVGPSHSSPVAG